MTSLIRYCSDVAHTHMKVILRDEVKPLKLAFSLPGGDGEDQKELNERRKCLIRST